MEDTVINSDELSKLTFTCKPINNRINSPLAVVISANESMKINDVKQILLKSLDTSEAKLDNVSMAKISEDKKYNLLMKNCTIKGTKAIKKYIYAFELNFVKVNSTCPMCNSINFGDLKFHKKCKNYVILCDDCTEHFEKIKGVFYCYSCMAESTSEKDFITIDKRETLISILNLSISLSDISRTSSTNNSTKRQYPFFFTLTFDNFAKSESDQGEKISVHFIDTEDHQCSLSCYYEDECLPSKESSKSARENMVSVCDYSCIQSLNNGDTENEHDSNVKKNIESILQTPQSQITLNKVDETLDDDEDDDDNDDDDKSIVEKKFITQKGEKISNGALDLSVLECLNEKSQILLDSTVRKLHEIEELASNFKMNRPSRRSIKPFENLKFSGRDDTTHPVRFTEDFDFFAKQEELTDYEKQFYFGQSLINEAAEWLKIQGYSKTFETMRKSFLNFFWNQQDQNCFITFLKHGKYNEKNAKLSRSVYFYKYAKEAKFLDNPPNDEILIDWLIEHFDVYIQMKLSKIHKKTIDEIYRFLKDLEFTNDKPKNSTIEVPLNFFSSSSSKKSRNGSWKDCLNNKYDIIQKDRQISYRCTTTKLWPMHTLSYNNPMSEMRHFNVTSDESSMHFLIDIPEKIYWIFTEIDEMKEYQVLGPVTIAKQNERQLIVSTCSTFKTRENLIAGQLLYFMRDSIAKPCGIITCSITEDSEYRYVISNKNERIVCLLCKEKIDEIIFSDNRTIAVNDFIVRYYEQKFYKSKHILRFLNENFCTIYSVWDKAGEKYDPLNPNYH
ncbi:uncharacterized protein LOC122500400 [Leptopilina heterotoma]|uniref:uncharacterized protein LOC122500400 n=1 Tax=Leptopilina heterotoma TaxID=63436 RepID=UPI001CA823E7|nr:uncharacterized protein LOC122500400 [Leptopilina heterotoma]